ncbi:MAG: hypothetical protein IPK81_10340 [Rhodospirillales bacterium]|nr:hypothetical protein [Rhodospirillales bacterium]QQS14519.1 MAG: hypothetical protein IPK81_10340 [Rhodospirillales bacterium]
MRSKIVIALIASAIGISAAAPAFAQGPGRDPQRPWCQQGDRNCDGRVDWKDYFYDPDRGYQGRPYQGRGREQTYGSDGSCSYPTPRGYVTGYRPEGKDRCCVETRYGPSCI